MIVHPPGTCTYCAQGLAEHDEVLVCLAHMIARCGNPHEREALLVALCAVRRCTWQPLLRPTTGERDDGVATPDQEDSAA